MFADLNPVSEAHLETPIGLLQLRANVNHLISIKFSTQQAAFFPQTCSSPLLQETIDQLRRYFYSSHHVFDLPFCVKGTPFQKKVWKQMREIRAGEVCTYRDLASLLRTSPRAIGGACRVNPLLIITPCHRVVARDGLGGFSGMRTGHFMDVKQWLLDHEGATNIKK